MFHTSATKPKRGINNPSPQHHHPPPPPANQSAVTMDDDHPKTQFTLKSNTIRTAIISLIVIVILITILHIYARCILGRQPRHQLGLFPTTTAGPHIQHPLDPPKTGLDPSIILSLPTFTFTKPADAGHETGPAECAVCLSILEEGEIIKLLPNCKHDFHSECIDKWLGSHSTCPICRAEAEPRLVLEPETGAQPTAPPFEGTSAKVSSGSDSRLGSFRRMLTRERSSRRIQEDGLEDIERQ